MALIEGLLPARYTHARLIAAGGMGRVFQACDEALRRNVAIKVLDERYVDDKAVRERFRREAHAAARLSSNPNIVTIFDVTEHEGRPMIVMEYLEGGSLERRIEGKGTCPPAQVLTWIEQAAAALDAAHAAGVVHRDIKPGNLLLDGDDQLYVSDFGVASAMGLDSLTETGTILGTGGYLSPEQARGERATAASDRYSLAVVAFELLTGRRPFHGDSFAAEAAQHATAPVPSIHGLNPALPFAFDRIFRRALAKAPESRFSSAAEFAAELRAALRDETEATAGFAPLSTATRETRVMPPRSAYAVREQRSGMPRRSRLWLVPSLLLLAAAGGIAGAFAATRSAPQHPRPSARRPVTVVRTVTQPGTTLEQTVTAPALPAQTQSVPATVPPPGDASGSALNAEGYAKMQDGDYRDALPLLEQAVQRLRGAGTLTEAYADYNLAYTRYALGQCSDVLALLDNSQAIQGRRKEIDALRRDARRTCG